MTVTARAGTGCPPRWAAGVTDSVTASAGAITALVRARHRLLSICVLPRAGGYDTEPAHRARDEANAVGDADRRVGRQLHLDLDTQFDDAFRRQPEERRRANGVARHQHEQF